MKNTITDQVCCCGLTLCLHQSLHQSRISLLQEVRQQLWKPTFIMLLIITAIQLEFYWHIEQHSLHLHQIICHFVIQPVALYYRSCTERKWGLHSNPQSEDLKTLFILTLSSPPEHPQVTKMCKKKQQHTFVVINARVLRLNDGVNWWSALAGTLAGSLGLDEKY